MEFGRDKWGDKYLYLSRLVVRVLRRWDGGIYPLSLTITTKRRHINIQWWPKGEGHRRPYR
jgi:hypothetical protein